MASAARKDTDEDGGGEYIRPDAEKAFEIYDKQIKPKLAAIAEKKGDLSQPWDDIKEQAHFPRKVMNFIIALENEEEAKRDHLLLALAEGLKLRKLFLPSDLVTMANGEDSGPVVPTGRRTRPQLVTVSDGTETDLADAGEMPFDEADEEELAAQQGRPGADSDED